MVEELTHDIELDEATVIPSDVDDEVKDEIPIDDLQNWNELDFEIIAYDPIAEFEEPIVDDAYDPIAVLEEPSSPRSARSL